MWGGSTEGPEHPIFNKNSKLQIFIRKRGSPKSLSILWSNFFHFWVVSYLFWASYLFSTAVPSVGRRKPGSCLQPPLLNLREKATAAPSLFVQVWFNTCTNLAMAKEEKRQSELLKPKRWQLSCWFEGGSHQLWYLVGTGSRAGMAPLSWAEPWLKSEGLSW